MSDLLTDIATFTRRAAEKRSRTAGDFGNPSLACQREITLMEKVPFVIFCQGRRKLKVFRCLVWRQSRLWSRSRRLETVPRRFQGASKTPPKRLQDNLKSIINAGIVALWF